MTTTVARPADASAWQQRIAGEWHGRPSLFDATGDHVGFEHVVRASVVDEAGARYWMRTSLEASGSLRNRLELGAQFDFAIVDSDQDRVYCGPDFFGTGQPYGSFVDAHYYSPGWQADLRTWNQVLPDGETQVYSSVLHDGWAVCAVFNGVYTRTALDPATDPATAAAVERWIAEETRRGPTPQVLPTKRAGAWRGSLAVHAATQEPVGAVDVVVEHEPLTLRRARQRVTWTGALDRSYAFERSRDGARTQYEGPDVQGNAISYGRALFTSQHLVGPDARGVEKVKGREFLLDPDTLDLAVVWELFRGDRLTHVVHGLLRWEVSS